MRDRWHIYRVVGQRLVKLQAVMQSSLLVGTRRRSVAMPFQNSTATARRPYGVPAGATSGGSSVPLVPIADFVDKRAQNTDFEGVLRRLERYALQSVSRDILKALGTWQRLCNCTRALQSASGEVTVKRSLKTARAYYSGLQHCGSPWVCPICQGKIVEVRRDEVERAIRALAPLGWSAAFLTLTFSHGPEHSLLILERRHAEALHHFRDSRAWKSLKAVAGLVGTIRGKEFSTGEATGWHPHTHTVMVFNTAAIPDGLEDTLWSAWSAALASVGLRATRRAHGKSVGLSVEATYGSVADYVVKTGCEPSKRPWGPEDEVTRGVSKSARSDARWSPTDLLRMYQLTGESCYFNWFREYAAATRGGSPVRWSPGLRGLLLPDALEQSDQDIADGEDQDDEVLGSIPMAVWRRVLSLDLRVELLMQVERGGMAAAVEFVKSFKGCAA